jgi:hypothetical protein
MVIPLLKLGNGLSAFKSIWFHGQRQLGPSTVSKLNFHMPHIPHSEEPSHAQQTQPYTLVGGGCAHAYKLVDLSGFSWIHPTLCIHSKYTCDVHPPPRLLARGAEQLKHSPRQCILPQETLSLQKVPGAHFAVIASFHCKERTAGHLIQLYSTIVSCHCKERTAGHLEQLHSTIAPVHR